MEHEQAALFTPDLLSIVSASCPRARPKMALAHALGWRH